MPDGTLRRGRYCRDQRKTPLTGQQRSDSMTMKIAVHLVAEAKASNETSRGRRSPQRYTAARAIDTDRRMPSSIDAGTIGVARQFTRGRGRAAHTID